MDRSILITQLIKLFLIIGLGFVLYKVKIMSLDFIQQLTRFLINVTVPLLLIGSVLQQEERLQFHSVAIVFVVGFLMYFVFPLIAFVVVKLLRMPVHDQGLYMFMMVYGNVGFMGLPLAQAVFGETGVFYAAIINLFFNLSCFSLGFVLMNYGKDGKVAFDLKKMLNPGLLGSVIALFIYLLNINLPAILSETIVTLGDLTPPLAMLIIGTTLARMDLRAAFTDVRLYLFTFATMFAVPLAMIPVFHLIISDPVILGSTYLMFIMPVANNCVLYAGYFGADEFLAAKGVFLSTLVCIVTVPILGSLCL